MDDWPRGTTRCPALRLAAPKMQPVYICSHLFTSWTWVFLVSAEIVSVAAGAVVAPVRDSPDRGHIDYV